MSKLHEELSQSQEEARYWKNEVKKTIRLKKELETHDTPSDLAARIVNLQGTPTEKEKALEEAQTSFEKLSSQVSATQKALEEEKESR